MTINISGINKADILRVLYNNSRPIGMGFLHAKPEDMTIEEAEKTIGEYGHNFDYLQGRVLKIDLSGDELDPWLYDRDIGKGAAEKAIEELRV